MKENVIISLADANYFELLNELVDSIKSLTKVTTLQFAFWMQDLKIIKKIF